MPDFIVRKEGNSAADTLTCSTPQTAAEQASGRHLEGVYVVIGPNGRTWRFRALFIHDEVRVHLLAG